MGMPNPDTGGIRVLIVSRSEKQWETLKSICEENELIAVPRQSDQTAQLDKQSADVLLVNLDESEDDDFDALIHTTDLPVLFNDSATIRKPTTISGRAWGRRLCEKLSDLVLEFKAPEVEQPAQTEEPDLRVVESAVPSTAADDDTGLSADMAETAADDDRGFYVAPAMDLEIDLQMLDGFEMESENKNTGADARPESVQHAERQSDPIAEQIPEIDSDLELDLEMDLELEFGPGSGQESGSLPAQAAEVSHDDLGLELFETDQTEDAPPGLDEQTGTEPAIEVHEQNPAAQADTGIQKSVESGYTGSGMEDSGIANLASEVWVLGASIGGPQAVKSFLRSLPANFPAGFILAQHIGVGFVSLLAEQLRQVTDLEVLTAEPGKRLLCGQLLVAPVEKRLVFDEYGYIQFAPITQRTIYSPSIDDVITETSKKYGQNTRAIIFSGMGSDGTRGCQNVVANGGTVWAQEASSCVISSMADSVRDTGIVSATGKPEELAASLIEKYVK